MPAPRHGLLVFNPAAGSGRSARRLGGLAAEMERRGVALALAPTEYAGHAIELARGAAASGADVVAVCGGDGTVNEVACGLAGSDTALALLPSGTANVLARELGVPRRLAAAAAVLAEGLPVRLSLGVATAGAVERRFVMMAGIGLDARVLSRFDPLLKRLAGRLAFLPGAAAEIARFPPTWLRLRTAERVVEGSLIVVANIRLYAGGFAIAPDADPTDGLLDFVVFRGRTRGAFGRYAAALALGRGGLGADVEHVRAAAAVVESASDASAPCHLDGDTMLATPLAFAVEPAALTVLVPPGSRYASRSMFSSTSSGR